MSSFLSLPFFFLPVKATEQTTSFSSGLVLSFWRVPNKHNSCSQIISSMLRNTGLEKLTVLGSLVYQNRESTYLLLMGTSPWPC